jgi:hypothetical protein
MLFFLLWLFMNYLCCLLYTFSIAPVTCYLTVTVNGLPFLSAYLTAWFGAIMVFLIKKLSPFFFKYTWVSFEVLKICDLKHRKVG